MPSYKIPDELAQFIAQHIFSIEKLAALLVLHESPDDAFSVESMAEHLQGGEASALNILEQLEAEGFAKKSAQEKYQYAPHSEAMAQATSELKAVYCRHPTKVLQTISSKSAEHYREFSEAFRVRRGISISGFAKPDYDCAVIGSSPLCLLEAIHQRLLGKKVVVIEAADRIGGAWRDFSLFGLPRVEIGPHIINYNEETYNFFQNVLHVPMRPMVPFAL